MGALLVPGAALAQSALTYRETVTVAADGSARVRADVESASGLSTAIFLRAIGEPSTVAADPAEVPVRLDRRGGGWCVVVGGGPTAAHRASITYDAARFMDPAAPLLPHGNRRLVYAFENLTDACLDEFSGTVILPPDVVVAAVDEVRPAVTDATVNLPYRLGEDAGRRTLTLGRSRLLFGDDVLLSARVRRQARTTTVFIVAGVLGALYLLTFRDLVRAPDSRGKETV